MKPVLIYNPQNPETSSLAATAALESIISGSSFHENRGTRHPLGIYNVSTSRILEKLINAISSLHSFMISAHRISDIVINESAYDRMRGDIEMLMYVTAEHLDDIKSVVGCFFSSTDQRNKNASFRLLEKSMKPLRDRTSAIANNIKHSHGRIRLFSIEFNHAEHEILLSGFCVEGSENGAIGPIPIGSTGIRIISITSLLFEVAFYLLYTSQKLKELLLAEKFSSGAAQPQKQEELCKALDLLLSVPVYTFEDIHPTTSFTFRCENLAIDAESTSPLYGSAINGWTKDAKGGPGSYTYEFKGDGVSRTFSIHRLSNVSLVHFEPDASK